MSKRSTRYSEEFKQQIIDLYNTGSNKVSFLSSEYGVSLKRVQRYMSSMNIKSIIVKKFRYHSEKIKCEYLENILKRDLSTTQISQKWCTDITYIHTIKDGWTYLASVMDFYSEKIIGYSYDSSMTIRFSVRVYIIYHLN